MNQASIDLGDHLDSLLDSTEKLFLEGGHSAVTLDAVAQGAGVPLEALSELYPTHLDILVAMLNREFSAMYQGIITDVERDPLGGLLSRIYLYTLPQVYQRPTARALYMTDPDTMRIITSHQHAQVYRPTTEIREELIVELMAAGMVKPGSNPTTISSVLSVISGGLALTAPHNNLSEVVGEMLTMFGQRYDAEVSDTGAGKAAFYRWGTLLDVRLRDNRYGTS